MIHIYDEPYSPYCAKVRKLMDFKGLRYHAIYVPYHDKIRLLKETGQDYVPLLRDGRTGVPWYRSVDYLERIRPEPSAYPKGTRAVVKVLESWEYDWFEDRLWALVASFLEPGSRTPSSVGTSRSSGSGSTVRSPKHAGILDLCGRPSMHRSPSWKAAFEGVTSSWRTRPPHSTSRFTGICSR